MSMFFAKCLLCGESYLHLFVGRTLLSGHDCHAEYPLALFFEGAEGKGKGIIIVRDEAEAHSAIAERRSEGWSLVATEVADA